MATSGSQVSAETDINNQGNLTSLSFQNLQLRQKMVRLTCAKLSDRNVVCVDIGESETVAALKDAIHVKNEDFECLARDLRLFLTKRKDSLLSGRGLAAVKLDQQGNPIDSSR